MKWIKYKKDIKMFEEWAQRVRLDTLKIGIKILKSKKIKEATIDFIWNQETPSTSKDVCVYPKDQFGVDIDSRTIARYMKNSLSMPFKKAFSRPIQIDIWESIDSKFYILSSSQSN